MRLVWLMVFMSVWVFGTGCMPVANDALPSQATPGDDDLTPGDDDSSTGDDDATSGDDDLSPGDDDSPSGDDDLSPGDDDSPSGDDDASPGDDDSPSGDDDVTAGDDDSPSGDDDASPGDDDSPSGDDDASPGDDDSPVIDLDQDGFPEDIDCDDQDAAVYPGAPELCDTQDNDCDGVINEGLQLETYYPDGDTDGYGRAGSSTMACAAPAGFAAKSGDCDDADPLTYPGASENCDGKDNNCNLVVDDSVLFQTYYRDADADSYGTPSTTTVTCQAPPAGYVPDSSDCNDASAAINPGALEVCDGLDNNCDGRIDDQGLSTYYRDVDGDGYGDPGMVLEACPPAPSGYVSNGGDCDDGDATRNPGEREVACNGQDENCSGPADDVGDADADGFSPCPAAADGAPADCDDTDDAIYPGAFDAIGDGEDSNCNAADDRIKTLAGTGTAGYSGDGGQATLAKLNVPKGLAVDAEGNLYIADNHSHVVRRVSTTGVITTVAGKGTGAYSGDNGLATKAELKNPEGLAFDAQGNLYIADFGNQRIRKVSPDGIITTIAGTGAAGYSGDGGKATSAKINGPTGLSINSSDTLMFADSLNNRVRQIKLATGIISNVAGTGTAGYSGDGGPATSAQLKKPTGVLLVDQESLFIADKDNHRIRKVALATGNISTVTGLGGMGNYSGDGGPATAAAVKAPEAVTIDPLGNLFIADSGNFRIRRVSASSGVITTVAGTGASGFSGDGAAATLAKISKVHHLLIDASGNLVFSDSEPNQRIRAILP